MSAPRYQRWSSGTNEFTSATVVSTPWPSMVYPPKTKTCPLAPTADAAKRPATPGTGRLSTHFPDLNRRTQSGWRQDLVRCDPTNAGLLVHHEVRIHGEWRRNGREGNLPRHRRSERRG